MSLYSPDLEDTDPDDLMYPDEPVRGRARVLFAAAVGPLIIGYATVVAVLALVISAATRAHFSALSVLSTAMPGWLATYQVPLALGGQHFGALPLLPTIAIMLLVGRSAANAADRLTVVSARETVPILVTIGVAHAIAGVVLAEVTSTASFFAGLLVPTLVSSGAAAIGLARRGYFFDVLGRFDELVVRGLRVGLLGLAALVGIGGLLFLFGLATSFPTAQSLFESGMGDGLGMFLLSAAYVPNAVVAGVSFAAGPGVSIGHLSLTPLHFTGGPLPRVPILAALPESGAGWWPIVVLLPLGIGALVGWVLRDACEDPIARLRAVGGAAAVVAVGCVVLGVGAGGRLASGVFNPLTVHPWSLGLAVVLWIALPAATVAWWAGPRVVLRPSRGLLDDAIEAEAAAVEVEDDAAADDSPEDPAEPLPESEAEPEPEIEAESDVEIEADDAVEPQAGPGGEDPDVST
jgi:uncharacterized protein DUF6350